MENLGPYIFGIALVGFIISKLYNRHISSKSGGVSIGGDNNGKIKIVNKVTTTVSEYNILDLIFGVIGVIGVYFTIWPIK